MATANVTDLEAKHNDFLANKDAWEDYQYLFHGGRPLRALASRFLTRRPKEPDDVFNARIKRFVYTNLLATILGWYSAKLFRREPELDFARANPDGSASEAPLPQNERTFFNAFTLNCDGRGTTFTDFCRQRLIDILLYGRSYTLVDLPLIDSTIVQNKRDQAMAGGLSPYLVNVEPKSITNWATDTQGNLLWFVLAVTTTARDFMGEAKVTDTWTYYDRKNFTIYSRSYGDKESPPNSAELVAGPSPHATSKLGRVPLFWLDCPSGIWLADRLFFPVLDYLNTENAFTWALMISNLAMPVITGASEAQITLSEVGAYILPENGTFTWSEHSGRSFIASAARLDQIREESYRVSYLIAQGRSSSATASAQSGISKQADMQPSADVLNLLGDVIRADQQLMLQTVGDLLGYTDLYVNVRGFSFDGTSPIDDLDLIDTGMALQIPSDSLDKELLKKAARVLLSDANQNLIAKVMTEIEAAPTLEDRQAEAAAVNAQAMADNIRQAITRGRVAVGIDPPKAAQPGQPPSPGGSGPSSTKPAGGTKK